jgi:hypothetical protein
MIVKASSLKYQDLLGHGELSTQLIVDGEVISETKLAVSDQQGLVWRLQGSIQL